MPSSKRHSQGFVLAEILVAVALLAILSSMAVMSYAGQQRRGRDTVRKSDLASIKLSLSAYAQNQIARQYPVDYPNWLNAAEEQGYDVSYSSGDGENDVACPSGIGGRPTDANGRVLLVPHVHVVNGTTDILSARLEPTYMRTVPVDPTNTGNFTYKYEVDICRLGYRLTATLENTGDRSGWAGGSSWVANGYQLRND